MTLNQRKKRSFLLRAKSVSPLSLDKVSMGIPPYANSVQKLSQASRVFDDGIRMTAQVLVRGLTPKATLEVLDVHAAPDRMRKAPLVGAADAKDLVGKVKEGDCPVKQRNLHDSARDSRYRQLVKPSSKEASYVGKLNLLEPREQLLAPKDTACQEATVELTCDGIEKFLPEGGSDLRKTGATRRQDLTRELIKIDSRRTKALKLASHRRLA